APHVVGVIALMLEANPALTPAQISRILQQTATPMLTTERFESGGGRLDADAALTLTFDASRPFGTHVPGWLDQRAYSIVHQDATILQATLPAGGVPLAVPVTVRGDSGFWQATLAWGTLPGGNDLDLVVRDGSGHELGRSDSFNGVGLFGQTEGTH